jgi:hypothetical protein
LLMYSLSSQTTSLPFICFIDLKNIQYWTRLLEFYHHATQPSTICPGKQKENYFQIYFYLFRDKIYIFSKNIQWLVKIPHSFLHQRILHKNLYHPNKPHHWYTPDFGWYELIFVINIWSLNKNKSIQIAN